MSAEPLDRQPTSKEIMDRLWRVADRLDTQRAESCPHLDQIKRTAEDVAGIKRVLDFTPGNEGAVALELKAIKAQAASDKAEIITRIDGLKGWRSQVMGGMAMLTFLVGIALAIWKILG